MEQGAAAATSLHRARPRGLKFALSLAALAAFATAAVMLAHLGRLYRTPGGFRIRLAGFEWNYYLGFAFWASIAGGLLFLALAPGWGWKRIASSPLLRSLPSRMIALAILLFWICEIGLANVLRVVVPEPEFLAYLFIACLGAAYYLVRGERNAVIRLGGWLRAYEGRGMLRIVFVLGAASSILGWRWYFGGYDEMVDSISQNSQARLLLLGHFTLDIPQRLRDVINFPLALKTVPSYSQFPPGYLVFMIPLVAIGASIQWLNIAAAAGIAVLTASLARRIGGPVAGLVAGLLLATSPYFIGLTGTAMNHAPACLALVGAAWCFLPAGPAPSRSQYLARSLLGGLLLGWAATIRPLSALAQGVVWCAVWGVLLLESQRRRAASLSGSSRADRPASAVMLRVALAGLALLPPLLFFMFYNSRTTGHALKMAYETSDPRLHRLGFTTAGPYPYTPFDAIDHFLSDLFDLNFVALGWGIGSWLLLCIWWLRTRLARDERILIALAAGQALAYALYSYHHLVLSARFLFEAFPFVAILFGLGIAPLLRRGGGPSGTLALAMLFLSLWAPAMGYSKFGSAFEPGAARHAMLDRFMRKLLPLKRATVVVFPLDYIDMCGRYFPHDPGQPDLWFVLKPDEARARQLPELAGCDWIVWKPEETY